MKKFIAIIVFLVIIFLSLVYVAVNPHTPQAASITLSDLQKDFQSGGLTLDSTKKTASQ